MNDSNVSLLRSVLKIGGGILIARGLATSDQIEYIGAGAVALFAVIWGYVHRKKPPTPPTTTSAPTPS